jgi:hypothetical protein
LFLRAPTFSFIKRGQFFCEAGRRFAAAGGGAKRLDFLGIFDKVSSSGLKKIHVKI